MHSQVLSMSSRYGNKRTNVCSKRTCVLLAIGVLSMSSKSRVKRTHVWAKGKRTCVIFSYWRARDGNSECTGKFDQSLETKKKSDL